MKAPFPWFGGKSRAADLVWSRLGDVANYVEPFAGSLAVLLARETEPRIETVNDRDTYLSNFWRSVARDPEQVAHYADWPVNEADLHARHKWLVEQPEFREKVLADPDYCDAKIAGWWVWGISQWIGGGWCSRPEWTGRGQGGRAPRGLNTVDGRRPNAHNMGVLGNPDGTYKRPVINRGGRGVMAQSDMSKMPRIDCTGHPGIGDGSTGVHTISNPVLDWMLALSARLRRVRVCCGDWARVVTPSCTWKVGGGMMCGVLLDPPYSHELRDDRLYSVESDVSAAVRDWAVAQSDNPRMRVALCGLAGEHKMPASWECVPWKAPRGYSKTPKTGAQQEVIWFSPQCLKQAGLFDEPAGAEVSV